MSRAPFGYRVEARCPTTRARAGVFTTPHGDVQTPFFMPVGTRGTVKGITADQLRSVGTQQVLANTYHLHLRPGEQRIRDLGGLHGFGPVDPESDEPVFHHAWEKRVFGLFAPTFAAGLFCVDEFRHAIERMGAVEYLDSSYYEHWLHALETLALEKGYVTREELDTAHAMYARQHRVVLGR